MCVDGAVKANSSIVSPLELIGSKQATVPLSCREETNYLQPCVYEILWVLYWRFVKIFSPRQWRTETKARLPRRNRTGKGETICWNIGLAGSIAISNTTLKLEFWLKLKKRTHERIFVFEIENFSQTISQFQNEKGNHAKKNFQSTVVRHLDRPTMKDYQI